MSLLTVSTTVLLAVFLAGCASAPPRWRENASARLEGIEVGTEDSGFREEYENAIRTFVRGDELCQAGEPALADTYFRLALVEAELLDQKLAVARMNRAADAQGKLARDQNAREAALEAQRTRERMAADAASRHSRPDKIRQRKDRSLPTQYIVRRGETLPQISARPEIYNDYRLWILLYRSNRDQVSDPSHIHPGQILRIPRNLSSDEIAEARRSSAEKPL